MARLRIILPCEMLEENAPTSAHTRTLCMATETDVCMGVLLPCTHVGTQTVYVVCNLLLCQWQRFPAQVPPSLTPSFKRKMWNRLVRNVLLCTQ